MSLSPVHVPFSAAHFLGHGFGLIPAPGSFAPSAFTVPPPTGLVPSQNAAARFGSSGPPILIVRGKTRNAKRTLSMSQEVHELLKRRRQGHTDDYWVRPSPKKPGVHLGSVRKAHDRVCGSMGFRGAMDLYNLRHTFATRSILSGTDVTILQKILGHSEIGMTMRYVKIAEHYEVEAVVKLEKYRAVKMQEVEEKMGMLQ
jgi:integrase